MATERECKLPNCGEAFTPSREWQEFCSDACRNKSFRKQRRRGKRKRKGHRRPAQEAEAKARADMQSGVDHLVSDRGRRKVVRVRGRVMFADDLVQLMKEAANRSIEEQLARLEEMEN